MKNIKVISTVMLIFTLGAASGVLGTHIFYKSRIEALMVGGHGAREEYVVERLRRNLGLDAQQLEQVRTIMRETHSEMRQIRKQNRPRTEAIMQKGQERIKKILRPEQVEKFEKVIAERKERLSKEER